MVKAGGLTSEGVHINAELGKPGLLGFQGEQALEDGAHASVQQGIAGGDVIAVAEAHHDCMLPRQYTARSQRQQNVACTAAGRGPADCS